MNITTKEDMERVLCESSYLDWFQKVNPSFIDVLQKMNEECGGKTKILQIGRQEYMWKVHGVEVNVVHTKEKITTTLSIIGARCSWVTIYVPSNLYIDFLSSYLFGFRRIWYDANSL